MAILNFIKRMIILFAKYMSLTVIICYCILLSAFMLCNQANKFDNNTLENSIMKAQLENLQLENKILVIEYNNIKDGTDYYMDNE